MERVLRCKDVGIACDFEARGKTDDEILEKAAEHTKNRTITLNASRESI